MIPWPMASLPGTAPGDLAAMFGKTERQIPGQLRERLVKEFDSAAEKAPDNMLFPLLAMFAFEGASDTDRDESVSKACRKPNQLHQLRSTRSRA